MNPQNRLFRTAAVLVLAAMLLTGCAKTETPIDPDANQEDVVSNLAPTPLQKFFLYGGQSMQRSWPRCQSVLQDSGYTLVQDGDRFTVYDPKDPHSYLTIIKALVDGYDRIAEMQYTLTEGEDSRTAKIVYAEDGTHPYYIDESTPVQSIDELRSYLHLAPSAEQTDEPSELFHQFYVPVANGAISYFLEDLKPISNHQGYFCQLGEGSIDFYDLDRPGSYIYGDLLSNSPDDEYCHLGNWGYHLETDFGIREANISGIGTDAPSYTIDLYPFGEGTEVQTLDELLNYLSFTERTPAEQSLGELREQARAAGCYAAVAYLGYGNTMDAVVSSSSAATAYPFAAKIDPMQQVFTEGNEVYCIVPAQYTDTTITVTELGLDETGNLIPTSTLYSGFGNPILLQCNVSDIMPNVLVTIQQGNATYSFSPYQSLRDGSLAFQTEQPDLFVFGRERTEENGKWVPDREFAD